MTLTEAFEIKEAELRGRIAAGESHIARINEAERIARDSGWRFDDLDNPQAGLEQAIAAPAADVEATIRRLPQTIGMNPEARRRFLKARGIL